MHILYFHQHFSTPKGAVGTRSYEMAQRLLGAGHQVTMVCGSYDQGDTGLRGDFVKGQRNGMVDGINVIEFRLEYSNDDRFIKRSMVFLKFALFGIKIALFRKFDLVFATSTPLTAGIPAIFARWLRRKEFVFEVRDLWPELPRAMGVITNPVVLWMLSVLEWVSYRSAHRCIGLAPGMVKGIIRRGVPENKVTMVPNASDIDIFQVDKSQHWRPDTVSTTDFMAVYTGTHGMANGLDKILDVAAEMLKRGKDDFKFVFVGSGKLKPELVAEAKTRNLTNVIFHDPVPKQKLAGLLGAADIGIMCFADVPAFYYGTSPNKFFDYIAAGLPSINNYPGWIAEHIIESKCGWVVPANDAKAFADALQEAQADKAQIQAMQANALALAEREFARDKLGKKWVRWVVEAK
ncbi:MAG: glycosyltransferase family 4 protein [Rhodobacteraceae bacterium]|nr:glycosyltransferase family 4 protein [Paracoccaceae bacterium]